MYYNLIITIMKKNFLWSILAIMMVGVLSLGFISCGSDEPTTPTPTPTPDPTPTPTASIKVNGTTSTSLTFDGSFDGKSGIDYKQSVAVVSTVQWTMNKDADWISVSPSNGNDALEMVIYPTSENATSDIRKATITLSGSGANATINVIQEPGLDANLSVSPNHIVTLSDGFAFDFNYGSNVKYYYVARYLPTALERKTDNEIIAEMSSDSSNRDTPSDGYVTSWQKQNPSTEYIICTVGYDQNGKHGALTKTTIKTKKGTNQALASISDVQYNDTYWFWTTAVNGYVTKYYMWFITNSNLYNATDAAVAWFFDKAMKSNPGDFSPIAQGDSWQRSRNGGSTFHVATWALDTDGNFSGVIGRFRGSISSSAPNLSIGQSFDESTEASKRYKTFK